MVTHTGERLQILILKLLIFRPIFGCNFSMDPTLVTQPKKKKVKIFQTNAK